MAWGKRLSVTTVVLLISSAAVAEPAGNSGFVPVTMGQAGQPSGSVVVASGDHLWKISQTHLDQVLGRTAEPGEVAPYWRSVIEMNQEHLRSGDPDLIFPGEVISLPLTG